MRVLLIAGAAAFLVAGVAAADVVVVGKREIRGEILEESEDRVVLKVGAGVLTFEKKNVKEIRREEELETLVGEARSLSKTLDVKALNVFDRAIEVARKKGDAKRADAIQKERNAYATKLEKQVVREQRPAGAGGPDEKTAPDDLFLREADLDDVRVYVNAFHEGDKKQGRNGANRLIEMANRHIADHQPRWAVGCFKLARTLDPEDGKRLWGAERGSRMLACGQAVREHDQKIARAAIEPVVKDDAKDPHVAYLEGRAQETANNPAAARDAFRRALEGVAVPNLVDLPVDWLRELSRRRAAGQSVGPGAPGFGEQWRRAESAHFVVYHELGDAFADDEPRAFEDARTASLLRLSLSEGDVNGSVKVPMYLFKSRDNYVKGGGPDWAGGHVGLVTLEDGESRTIYTFPGRRMDTATMQHELAHVLVAEAFPKLVLPAWASEGVACFCEPDSTRTRRRIELGQSFGKASFVPVKDFLARAAVPSEDREAISIFYAEASVVFAALHAKAGSIKEALTVAARIARKGPEVGLRELGTDPAALEAEIKAEYEKK